MKSCMRAGIRLGLKCYPLVSGCGMIANTGFLKTLTNGAGWVTTRLGGGTLLRVDLEDYVGRTIYYMGDLDPKLTEVCRRVIREGDTVLDIGANCGLVTMLMAGWVGAGGRVHAFEPQGALASKVEESVDLNGYKQVRVHQVGLSEEAGHFTMRLVEGNQGTASLEAGVGSVDGDEVEVYRTDEYLRGLALESIRLIKIDVEGHEPSVLRGGEAYLNGEVRPEVLVFEVDADSEDLWTKSAAKILLDWGYDLYAILQSYWSLQLQRVGPGISMDGRSHDFVAIDSRCDCSEIKKRLGL